MPEPVCIGVAHPECHEELGQFESPDLAGGCRADGLGEMRFDYGIMRTL